MKKKKKKQNKKTHHHTNHTISYRFFPLLKHGSHRNPASSFSRRLLFLVYQRKQLQMRNEVLVKIHTPLVARFLSDVKATFPSFVCITFTFYRISLTATWGDLISTLG